MYSSYAHELSKGSKLPLDPLSFFRFMLLASLTEHEAALLCTSCRLGGLRSLAPQRDRSPKEIMGPGKLGFWQGSKGTESILLPTSLKEAFKGKGFLSTKSVSERKKHSARSAEEAASCSVSEARSMKRKKHSGGQGEQSSPWKASCFTPTTCG